jgi:probable FeS assembly SUF system protein SufT
MHSYATLTRDVEAVMIPYGGTVSIPEGAAVSITQALGGSFTVITPQGMLARIDGRDADALGEEYAAAAAEARRAEAVAAATKSVEERAWDALKTCYDPEIPVNIVDLGLVYDLRITPLDAGGNRVDVKMTLTAPGCGMGTVIAAEAQHKIGGLPGVEEAKVDIVWDPPWSPQMISAEGKERLGMM